MNDYKVPQDVEAEDKLLGPFSFRQFIYLIIVALSGLGAFALFQLFPPLAIIPLPIILFFGALALPIKKDQPMEIYLAAVLSFYLKPRNRLWQPDGVEHLIEITAPKIAEPTRTKGLSQDEAVRRLSYLSDVVDTGGWAIKNAVSQDSSTLHEDFANEARTAEDIFEDTRVSNNINSMIELNDRRRKQQIMQNMDTAKGLSDFTTSTVDEVQDQTFRLQDPRDYYQQAVKTAQPLPNNSIPIDSRQTEGIDDIHLDYNPYPDSIRQSVIQPIISGSPQPAQNPISTAVVNEERPSPKPVQPQLKKQTTSEKPLNSDIMKLVSEGKDLSVETLARQANKIHEKEVSAKKQDEGDLDEEVIISFR